MKRRFAILIILGFVAAACGVTNSDGSSGIGRVPTTSTPLTPPAGVGNPNLAPSAIVEPCVPPEGLEPFCESFTYEQGSVRIVWDRWFWGQGMFSRGTVEVFDGGDLLVSGPFSDASVMKQETNGDLTLLKENGDVIAVVTQADLSPAIQEALEQAGIGETPP